MQIDSITKHIILEEYQETPAYYQAYLCNASQTFKRLWEAGSYTRQAIREDAARFLTVSPWGARAEVPMEEAASYLFYLDGGTTRDRVDLRRAFLEWWKQQG